jgi:hypothetical protein
MGQPDGDHLQIGFGEFPGASGTHFLSERIFIKILFRNRRDEPRIQWPPAIGRLM